MVLIIGRAHVAYKPRRRAVELSKIARAVEMFARRLQTQETMTAQIADVIDETLQLEGVGVMIEVEHHCMSLRAFASLTLSRSRVSSLVCFWRILA